MTLIVHKQWSASSMRPHNVVDGARVVAGIRIVARQSLYPHQRVDFVLRA